MFTPQVSPLQVRGFSNFGTCLVGARGSKTNVQRGLKLTTLTYCQIELMICIEAEIPLEICDIDDELKAIYHSRESFCIWVFSTRVERNRFVEETIGMSKDQRQEHFDAFF